MGCGHQIIYQAMKKIIINQMGETHCDSYLLACDANQNFLEDVNQLVFVLVSFPHPLKLSNQGFDKRLERITG